MPCPPARTSPLRRRRPPPAAGSTLSRAPEAAPRPGDGAAPAPGALPHELVRFAHNSERQFAKLLDFYGIAWQYEPRTFVLETDDEGNPLQAFSPDFYLPAYDLYYEITTLNQKLVTKKNRKVRRLQELHPDVRVKILYQRDYLNLLVKYGLEEPEQFSPLEGGQAPLRTTPRDADLRSAGGHP